MPMPQSCVAWRYDPGRIPEAGVYDVLLKVMLVRHSQELVVQVVEALLARAAADGGPDRDLISDGRQVRGQNHRVNLPLFP